ncbi:MAG: adenylosuccinate lyase, partial [Chloroflexi bacterium]|nr:adenylosuccinate lyase [Chloroflexota bacterium]
SNDVKDTALAMQMSDATGLLLDGIDALLTVLADRAIEFKHTLAMGRSHGIHAEPMSFGLKLALWWSEMRRNRERVAGMRERIAVGMLSGPVGTFAGIPMEIEEDVCAQLGLKPAEVSNQVIQRDRHAEFLQVLALVASTLDKMATEIRALQRTEVGEVEEPFGRPGYVSKGSSSMPHKRNPELSERICGLARVIRSNSIVGLENVALWHERDISHSSAERIVLADSALALDYILDLMTGIIAHMTVKPERMRKNMDMTHGLVFSPRVMLALVESGLERGAAYDIVQHLAMQALDQDLSFQQLVGRDESVSQYLDDAHLAVLFDYGFFLEQVDAIYDRLGIEDANSDAVLSTNFPGLIHRGKVRDTYRVADGMMMMVATDRISAFDVIMDEPVPDKGVLLAQMSAFWFRDVIGDIVNNHMVGMAGDEDIPAEIAGAGALAHLPDEWNDRAMIIREAERIDMECVVRGYLAGSAWAEYETHGTVNGEVLPSGLRPAEMLPQPMFTPSTKAEEGHDIPLTETEAIELVGEELHERLKRISIAIFERASKHAAVLGMILVDTKFEFGFVDGELTLIDEVLTPDSSRFWDANDWKPGAFPPAYDKQHLREWLMETGWNREPPPPEVPDNVLRMTRQRYISVYERLTGTKFKG